jgi:hypothetical protein
MGWMRAAGMREAVDDGQISCEAALIDHLQVNHYPPINLVFLPVAEKAIREARRENWEKVIVLPNKKRLTVAKIVEELHLDVFL